MFTTAMFCITVNANVLEHVMYEKRTSRCMWTFTVLAQSAEIELYTVGRCVLLKCPLPKDCNVDAPNRAVF